MTSGGISQHGVWNWAVLPHACKGHRLVGMRHIECGMNPNLIEHVLCLVSILSRTQMATL